MPITDNKTPDPGTFRHQVDVQRSTATRGSSGSVPPTWNETDPFARARMSITPLSARETLSNLSIGVETTHRLTGWWIPGITADMRIRFGSRYFDIISIRNIGEQNTWMELLCREGRTPGA